MMTRRRILLGVAGGLAFWREANAGSITETIIVTPAVLMNLGALQPLVIAMKVGRSFPILYRATDLDGTPLGPTPPDPAIPYPVNAPPGSIATNPSWNQSQPAIGTLLPGNPYTYTALAPGTDSISATMVSSGRIYVGIAQIIVGAQ